MEFYNIIFHHIIYMVGPSMMLGNRQKQGLIFRRIYTRKNWVYLMIDRVIE